MKVVYRNIVTQRKIDRKIGYTSRRVNNKFTANLPYDLVYRDTQAPPAEGRDNLSASFPGFAVPDNLRKSASNQLYAMVKDVVTGPQGEALTSTLEWKKSLDMISGRATQLAKAYLALRKFQFAEVHRILELPRLTTVRQKRRIRKAERSYFVGKTSPTSMWLEYWMGWAPLHGEIGHALETLVKPPPLNQHFSVGLVNRFRDFKTLKHSAVNHYITTTGKCAFGAYGNFQIINHNLNLANQLGFVNPALSAWQMLPFSFIVDWFVNVGQVIGSLTDFAGVQLTNIGRAEKSEVDVEYVFSEYTVRPGNPKRKWYYQTQTGKAIVKSRVPNSLPTPKLASRQLDRLSLTRGATAVSLLNEIFLRK